MDFAARSEAIASQVSSFVSESNQVFAAIAAQAVIATNAAITAATSRRAMAFYAGVWRLAVTLCVVAVAAGILTRQLVEAIALWLETPASDPQNILKALASGVLALFWGKPEEVTQEVEEVTQEVEEVTQEVEEVALSDRPAVELRVICSQKGIRWRKANGGKHLSKAQMIEALKAA